MSPFKKEDRDRYTDLSTVESQRNDLTAEEFPEGPFGSSITADSLGKSTPWRVDQRPPNRFDYENRSLHKQQQRDFPSEDQILQPELDAEQASYESDPS
ncbi:MULTISPECIES: hypothetical protein [Paenibacillus]|uniref:Cytosolic protein n=1 Tax=Paenibacillus campinasensis TaxID=66347 RepID=A0ABW9SU67_9BACL|nr:MULTISPECIES: hypothetical protein [Paenibacillus]MUG64525.1 hypothetical protein [Paenibacillus campinasensis]PAK55239.1 hypothetical protein CHH75_02985 [Paenibacillus sp. 7541]